MTNCAPTPSDNLIRDAVQAWNTSIVESGNDFDRMKSTLTSILPHIFNTEPARGETAAARDVLAERRRQIEEEGFKPEEDDTTGALSAAAAAYAFNASLFPDYKRGSPLAFWPWAKSWWKPTTPRRDLVKAGALILAEIERLDRASPRSEAER